MIVTIECTFRKLIFSANNGCNRSLIMQYDGYVVEYIAQPKFPDSTQHILLKKTIS
jgi:hypothetical protein